MSFFHKFEEGWPIRIIIRSICKNKKDTNGKKGRARSDEVDEEIEEALAPPKKKKRKVSICSCYPPNDTEFA